MRLRHQALIGLGLACLASGGCARILGTVLAPQQAALATTGAIADTTTAPARTELAGMERELARLRAGGRGDTGELRRLDQELRRRLAESPRQGAAQDDPARLRPWHPRAPPEPVGPVRTAPSDRLVLGAASPERGLATNGVLPDGVARADLPAPLDLSRIRIGPPR